MPQFVTAIAANGAFQYAYTPAGEPITDESRFVHVVVKARSGNKLHVKYRGGAVHCNSRMVTGSAFTVSHLRHANAAQFCDKCFGPITITNILNAVAAAK